MKVFFEVMGYNCEDLGSWQNQVKMLGQLLLIGAIMTLPMLIIMGIAGWMDRMSGL